ncbi:hypothetical protein FGKAn22_08900 [Ferrigenium kumadai]|uniref:Uncharacterized protein n=1 Tax=Ferrigenium kumadai TaxID=1682490 RepID=A0AAN1W0E0_9PROT|nr:hypothetical protein [Ferrigenium kumadai]BBI99197.1 hypothetical protein FGKAn22_08900 [Ferrigenium kumadai]
MDRYLHTIYCDDIRLEVGNKQSLMGLYASDLFVHEFPATLPKLCIVVILVTPIDNPLRKLTVKVTKDGESLIEAPMTEEQLNQPQSEIIENGDKGNPDRRIAMNLTFMLTPFSVEKECVLRVLAETESGELRGNALRIKIGEAPQIS